MLGTANRLLQKTTNLVLDFFMMIIKMMIFYLIILTNALGNTLENTCELNAQTRPTTDNVQPLSEFPDGPLYYRSKGEEGKLTFEDARQF